MKMKVVVLITVLVLIIGSVGSVLAYNAGFCLKNGCYCHQYEGKSGDCDYCGHSKPSHL